MEKSDSVLCELLLRRGLGKIIMCRISNRDIKNMLEQSFLDAGSG